MSHQFNPNIPGSEPIKLGVTNFCFRAKKLFKQEFQQFRLPVFRLTNHVMNYAFLELCIA